MRKTKLSPQDAAIGRRFREVREEVLGITRTACAKQLGMDRNTLANYESCRTPLRFEVALRFCREMVISEEWLATGKHTAYRAVLESMPGADWMRNWAEFDQLISMRQCVDLWSDPSSRHIPSGTLYSVAYSSILSARHALLVKANAYHPTVVLTDADQPATAVNYLRAVIGRHVAIMLHEADLQSVPPPEMWRKYANMVLQTADLAFQHIALGEPMAELEIVDSEKWSLPEDDENVSSMPVTLADLRSTLRALAATPSKRAELVQFLGATDSNLSHWLTDRKPGGEVTLKMLEWVQAQRGKTKRPAGGATPTDQRTRTKKSREEKPSPSP